MKIVFLNPSGELGGAETALLEMLAALREARPAWKIGLVASAAGPLVERAAALGVDSDALTFPPQLARLGEWGRRGSLMARAQLGAALCTAAVPSWAYASRLRDYLRERRPDVVHTNGLKMHVLGARCTPPQGRVVWHLHDYPDARPLTAKLLRGQVRRCAAIVANSESVARAARLLFTQAPSVRTVYNAVDLGRFSPDGAVLNLDELAGLPRLPADGVRVGLVATFAKWKGHDVFLSAMSRLRTSVPVRGYVIGGPIYATGASQFSAAELRDLAKRSGVNGSVGFTGRIDDVPAALRALDVVVHASTEPEPFGLVIAEAMACGRPVIVSHAGGAAEIAEAGALFHAPGNAEQLAARISELVDNAQLRRTLGAKGRESAHRLFGRARLATSLVSLYDSITSGRAA